MSREFHGVTSYLCGYLVVAKLSEGSSETLILQVAKLSEPASEDSLGALFRREVIILTPLQSGMALWLFFDPAKT
ncbi:hypothetical protein [Niallia oryzisoli]|uniref:hypothetical protein n=1 Tax=Niallia oryzisoli TaxID=1737571 RepID=UPI003734E2C0